MNVLKTYTATVICLAILSACSSRGGSTAKENCQGKNAFSGSGYRVMDGDTFKLKMQSGEIKVVRLNSIDAPEKGQTWSHNSKQMLQELILGKSVCVFTVGKDRYDRLLGNVYSGDTEINAEMVKRGGAWAFRRYLKEKRYIDIENVARKDKLGLWSMPPADTVAPWDYRQGIKSASEAGESVSSPGAAPMLDSHNQLNCSAKPMCKQMANCQQANEWLKQCGPDGIDGDMDGKPCEQICK